MLQFADAKGLDLSGRCVRPLCFGAPGDEYYGMTMFETVAGLNMHRRNLQLGLQGSCTLVLYRDQYFVLFTRHQIAMIPNELRQDFQARLELLFVLMDDGRDSTNLPIRTLLFAFDSDYGDDEDDFVVGVVEGPMMTDFMRAQFFPVGRTLIGQVMDRALCSGFLSHRQQVLMERNGLRTQLSCKSGIVTHRSSRSTGTVKYENDSEALDGFSGGAVFLVRLNPDSKNGVNFVAFIDGVIQRGGSGYLRYLTIERILGKLDERVFRA